MYAYWVRQVLNVVDGDTIDCRIDLGFGLHANFRFRVTGIDTPEVRGEERPQGLEAKEFATQWLEAHDENLAVQTSRLTGATVGIGDGAFGRWLGNFYDFESGETLTDALTAAGYAT